MTATLHKPPTGSGKAGAPPALSARARAVMLAAALAVPLVWLVLGASGARAAAYVPHEVIVGYRTPSTAATGTSTGTTGTSATGTVTAQGAGTARALRRGARHAAPRQAVRTAVLKLPANETVAAALASLRRRPGVAFAQPDYIAHTDGGPYYPNDPGRARTARGWERLQWNLLPAAGIDAPQAWANLIADHRAGGRGVVVAVLDTGVAYRNWRRFYEAPDFGGTRFVAPYDFVAHNRYPLDRNGHGTFVAGMIAEATNNGLGLTGIAYNASIMPVRVLNGSGEGAESTIAQGIRYAVDHGAQVINLSLEFLPSQVRSAGDIPLIVSAIAYAHAHGVVVVGAAGNDQASTIAYPAAAPGVISVGATTRDRCLADYSNGGYGLDLVAPGGGDDAFLPSDPNCHPDRSLPSIYQMTLTDPPHWNRFGYPSFYIGTSMASPEVSAGAALVIASRVIGRHPTPNQIALRLEQTATPLGGSQPNTDYGWGLLNIAAATDPNASLTPITF